MPIVRVGSGIISAASRRTVAAWSTPTEPRSSSISRSTRRGRVAASERGEQTNRHRRTAVARPERKLQKIPGRIMEIIRAFAASLVAACLVASGASAQSYPQRAVTMLVAFPPGGGDDATARILQEPMQKALGQTIVVENLSGAGGMIA